METNVLYNKDCLKGMQEIPDESIDLVVTDCPYKIVAGGVTILERDNDCGGILTKRKGKHIFFLGGTR